MKSATRCRGSWRLGNACGVCGRCKREAIAAISERDELRALIVELADRHSKAKESFHWLIADRIRERLDEITKRYQTE